MDQGLYIPPPRREAMRRRVEDEELEQDIPIERLPGFYETQDTIRIGPLKVRLFFHPDKLVWCVFFKKKNSIARDLGAAVEDTHMSVSAHELKPFINALELLYNECASTPYNETPRRLITQAGKLTDKNDKNYWDSEVAIYLPSRTTVVRPYRDPRGTYYLRLWAPRQSVNKFPDWVGKTMSISMGGALQFIQTLKMFLEQIEQQDSLRLHGIQIPAITSTNEKADDSSPEIIFSTF